MIKASPIFWGGQPERRHQVCEPGGSGYRGYMDKEDFLIQIMAGEEFGDAKRFSTKARALPPPSGTASIDG